MKKIFKFVSVLTAFLFTFSIIATADMNISYEASSATLKISGTADGGEGTPITVCVGLDGNDLFSDENPPLIAYMAVIGKDGHIDFSIPVPSYINTGKYNIYIGYNGLKNAEKFSVLIFDLESEEVDDLMSKINLAASENEFKLLLNDKNNALKIGIDVETEQNYDNILRLCYRLRSTFPNSIFTKKDFVNTFNYSKAVTEIQSGAVVSDILKKSAHAFGINYDDYEETESNVRTEVDKIYKTWDFSNEFLMYDKILLSAKIRAAKNFSAIEELVSRNSDVLGICFDGDYSKIAYSKRYKVFSYMYNSRMAITEFGKIEVIFNESVKRVINENKNVPAGGSGNIGSGSSNIVTVAEPVETKTSVEFTDIDGHFAKEAINELVQKGVLQGYPDNTFRPNDFVTRAEISKIIVKAFNIEPGQDTLFDDVNKDAWAYSFISALYSKGFIKGDGKRFYPNENITRQDVAVIFARMLNETDAKTTADYYFSDLDNISGYARDSVNFLAAKGFLLGDGYAFRPHSGITRGETAVLISRILKGFEGDAK